MPPRQVKSWTPQEETALFAGVANLGTGKWVIFWRENLAALGDRTPTAIKEKYGYITEPVDKADAVTFKAAGGGADGVNAAHQLGVADEGGELVLWAAAAFGAE